MKKVAVISLSLIFYVLQLNAQTEQNMAIQKPSIQVQSQGKISAMPDAAELVIIIRYADHSLNTSISATENASEVLVKSIKKYLADSNDVLVELPTTQDLIKWDTKKNKDLAVGYETTLKITVNLINLTHLHDFFKELFKHKIYEIERLSYFNVDQAPFLKEVRLAAVEDAYQQTALLAIANKVKAGRLLSLQTFQVDVSNASFYSLRTYNLQLDGDKLMFSKKKILYTCSATMTTEIE